MTHHVQKTNHSQSGMSLIETLLAIFILSSVLTVLVINLNKSLLILLETKYRAYASDLGQNCVDEVSFTYSSNSWSNFKNDIGGLITTPEGGNLCIQPNEGSWTLIEQRVEKFSELDDLFFKFQQANPIGHNQNNNIICDYAPPIVKVFYSKNKPDLKNIATELDIESSLANINDNADVLPCNPNLSGRFTRIFELDENHDDVVEMTFEVVTDICIYSPDNADAKIDIYQANTDPCTPVSQLKKLKKEIAVIRSTIYWSKTVGANINNNSIVFNKAFVGN